MLDEAHGNGTYSVTNLGACGSTMQKKGDSPFWQRPQFHALTAARWDIVTIMLGTNDAKDVSSGHSVTNWHHNCGGVEGTTIQGCTFAEDYHAMIETVSKLGPAQGVPPKIFVMIPPPLMQDDAYGMNQTVINGVLPKLIPMIHDNDKDLVVKTIDIFEGMGGESKWSSDPRWPTSCGLNSSWKPCGWWCDNQSCDQCHPNDNGYNHLAVILKKGLGL
jgi:lysophospholipase L1-like esterase